MAHNPSLRYLTVLALILASVGAVSAEDAGHGSDKYTLVVLAYWDDEYKTPATGVYIEAHSFDVNGTFEKSYTLKMVKPGRYEAPIPPGTYDVFVSEASSTPRCRRMSTAPGYLPPWTLMLEHDTVYLQR